MLVFAKSLISPIHSFDIKQLSAVDIKIITISNTAIMKSITYDI